MKKTVLKKGIAMVAITLSLISCSTKSASEYNNKMMEIINASTEDMAKMNEAMTSKNWTKAEEVRNLWDKNLEKSISDVESQGDFNGDSTFKDAVLKAMNSYKKIVTEDYKKLIEIRKSGDTSKQKEEETALNNINKALEDSANELNQASTAFEILANKQ